eukprot:s750_g15.t1
MRVLNRYVRGVSIKEVLSVVRNNEIRRFQIKVTKPDAPEATWKGLPWKVVAIRAVQGHNKSVMEHAKLSNIVKRVFTLDPTFKKQDLDSEKFPMTNLRPDLVPELMRDICRVIYHSCDRSAMEKIIHHGLIPGGWPQKTGRAHNHDSPLEHWCQEAGGNASRKTILHGLRYRDRGAKWLYIVSNRPGYFVARLGFQ